MCYDGLLWRLWRTASDYTGDLGTWMLLSKGGQSPGSIE